MKTDPLHIAGGVSELVSVGIGLTTTSTLYVDGLVQLLAVSVYTYRTVIGDTVVFVSVSFGLPVPDVGPAGVIPATDALVHPKTVPAVPLVGV